MNKLQIVEPSHVAEAWIYIGHVNASEFARAKANEHMVVGMNVLAELLEARTKEAHASISFRNIELAAAHGFNPSTHKLAMSSSAGGVFLAWEPLDSVDAPATTAEKLAAAADGDAGVTGA